MSEDNTSEIKVSQPDSLLELNNYKFSTKRIEDGYNLCNDLQNFAQERSDIEKSYAKNLKQWSRKWSEIIEKGSEYGTMETAWKSVLIEADTLADIHLDMKQNLWIDVVQNIRNWQKENYHKTIINLKERKDIEDTFRNVQKQWTKLLIDVDKCKMNYYAACKFENSTVTNLEKNVAHVFSSMGEYKKFQVRVQKTEFDVRNTRIKYEKALDEINEYKSFYMNEMSKNFNKCQLIEKLRLTFFKKMLLTIHRCLNFTTNDNIQNIYDMLYRRIDNINPDTDLNLWSSNNYEMLITNVPKFMEYNNKKDISDVVSRTSELSTLNNCDENGVSNSIVAANNLETLQSMKPKKILTIGKKAIVKSDQQVSDILQQYFSKSKKVVLIEF